MSVGELGHPGAGSAGPALVHALGDRRPVVADGAWIAPTAVVVGDVTVHEGASVWYGAVLRADADRIAVGARSNLQDGVVAHVDEGRPLQVGSGVSVGHRAVLHGCVVEDDCLVGMGAVLLNGCRIGAGSVVAAGAVVLEGMQVPSGALVAGVPARVRRVLTDVEQDDVRANARLYEGLREEHRRSSP